MRVDSKERSPQKVCYSSGHETGRLDLEEQRGEDLQSAYPLLCLKSPVALAGSACWSVGLGKSNELGKGKFVGYTGGMSWGSGELHRSFVAEVGMNLRD